MKKLLFIAFVVGGFAQDANAMKYKNEDANFIANFFINLKKDFDQKNKELTIRFRKLNEKKEKVEQQNQAKKINLYIDKQNWNDTKAKISRWTID